MLIWQIWKIWKVSVVIAQCSMFSFFKHFEVNCNMHRRSRLLRHECCGLNMYQTSSGLDIHLATSEEQQKGSEVHLKQETSATNRLIRCKTCLFRNDSDRNRNLTS